ncbi:MAG: CPBP family intramembrane metalloprotease [Pseudonocardia sp.]|nr:CPBP family intramembrane metalloprotease [Pseudonocardia sp.]
MTRTTTAPGPSPLVRWTREHRLLAFFGLTFVLSWWSWPLWAFDLAPTAHWPCGPLLAALVVVGVTEGRAGYRELGARLLRWRVGWGWWLVAVGTPLAVLALAAAANVTIWDASSTGLAGIAWGGVALTAALRFVDPLDGPFGEEPGWRGYALPWLQARRSPLAAAAVLGPVVALWHLPLVVTGRLAPFGLVVTAFITVVYVWLFDRTGGSVLLTLTFHVAQGTVPSAALGFAGADAARMDWLTGTLWIVLAVALVALDRRAWGPAPAAAVASAADGPVRA